MFRDTDILPDNTYTHGKNGSQTCSWLDHIAMSDVLSKSTVDCRTLQDVEKKVKQINCKFVDVGLKCRFYKLFDTMLDEVPGGLQSSIGPRSQIGLMI